MADDDRPLPGRSEGTEDVHIRTFLIADVRGYTLFTQARGDEAAAKLAAKFADIAREIVEARGGTLLELRGDEALCVFASAREAIRAAVDAQHRFVEETIEQPELPLTVGIGLDAGEAVPVQGGYRGAALNLAARLCGQARAGEILATREVTHLARRIEGAGYVDRGSLSFKGISDPVAVVRVVPEGMDPVERLRPYGPPPAISPSNANMNASPRSSRFHARRAKPNVPTARNDQNPGDPSLILGSRHEVRLPVVPRLLLMVESSAPDVDLGTDRRAERIGSYWANPKTRTFAELLIDCEEDRMLKGVLVGMLAEMEPK
jgi:class 3 adenylate cyclase